MRKLRLWDRKDVMSWDLDRSLYLELELHGLMLLRGMRACFVGGPADGLPCVQSYQGLHRHLVKWYGLCFPHINSEKLLSIN